MFERIDKIAKELAHGTYKDATHGEIARLNFLYGAAQAKLEIERMAKEAKDKYAEADCIASDADAPTDRIAYLAGKRDAMSELLELLKD